MKTIFQSSGLRAGARNYPAITLAAGEVGGWQGAGRADCAAILDMVTGLSPAPRGGAVWFGRDLAGETHAGVLQTMRRIAHITSDGGLIGNLRVYENILLPYTQRRLGEERDGLAVLEQLMEESPAGKFLGRDNLRKLPHELDRADLPLVAVLRAALVRPAAVVACDIMRPLEQDARERLAGSLVRLRAALPDAAWLFVQSETALPHGMDGNILPPLP